MFDAAYQEHRIPCIRGCGDERVLALADINFFLMLHSQLLLQLVAHLLLLAAVYIQLGIILQKVLALVLVVRDVSDLLKVAIDQVHLCFVLPV